MSHFERAFTDLMYREANYTLDLAGENRYGISEEIARKHGYTGIMEEIDTDLIRIIYAKEYWNPLFDNFTYLVAFNVFDVTVYNYNGLSLSVKWLQKISGIPIDGVLGKQTIDAVNAMQEEKVLLLFNAQRLEFLTHYPNWHDVGRRWVRRLVYNMRLEG